jgi:hypothetical protein
MPGNEASTTLRASDLIGRAVYRPDGEPLGRIADLVVEPDDRGRYRVTEVIAVKGPWGRLLGYERASAHGPWLLETLARAALRRDSHRVRWDELIWGPPR